MIFPERCAGDATTGVTGLHADLLLNIKNICLQKLTRSGDILGVLLLRCKKKVLIRENLKVLPKREPMVVRQPRYSKEEIAWRGDRIYETQVRPQVEAVHHGKIVAIDIETGTFEVASEILTATDRLFERLPEAQPWIVRIGDRSVHRFGARSLKKTI